MYNNIYCVKKINKIPVCVRFEFECFASKTIDNSSQLVEAN